MGAGTTVEWCIGVIRGGRMPVPKMCRVLYQFYFVARVRRLYVLHHDAQKSVCHTCMCVSVLYESVQKSPFHPLRTATSVGSLCA